MYTWLDDLEGLYVYIIRPSLFWMTIAALTGVIVELLRGGVRRKSPTPEEKREAEEIRRASGPR